MKNALFKADFLDLLSVIKLSTSFQVLVFDTTLNKTRIDEVCSAYILPDGLTRNIPARYVIDPDSNVIASNNVLYDSSNILTTSYCFTSLSSGQILITLPQLNTLAVDFSTAQTLAIIFGLGSSPQKWSLSASLTYLCSTAIYLSIGAEGSGADIEIPTGASTGYKLPNLLLRG